MHGISTDLNSGEEDDTDSHSGCEWALAHNHAQLHKKLGTTIGFPPQTDCNQTLLSGIRGRQGKGWSAGFITAPTTMLISDSVIQQWNVKRLVVRFKSRELMILWLKRPGQINIG